MSVVTIIGIEAEIGGYVGHSEMDPFAHRSEATGRRANAGVVGADRGSGLGSRIAR